MSLTFVIIIFKGGQRSITNIQVFGLGYLLSFTLPYPTLPYPPTLLIAKTLLIYY